MSTQYNPDEAARLCREAYVYSTAARTIGYDGVAAHLAAMADKLEVAVIEIARLHTLAVEQGEAAQARIAELEAEVEKAKLWSCPECEFTFAAYHTDADGSMSCPVCEVEAMRPVVQCAEDDQDAECSCDDYGSWNGHNRRCAALPTSLALESAIAACCSLTSDQRGSRSHARAEPMRDLRRTDGATGRHVRAVRRRL